MRESSAQSGIALLVVATTVGMPALATGASDALEEVLVVGQRDQVVTVAGKLPARAGDIPHSISVVDEARIEERAVTTLDGALRGVTGVTVIPNSDGQSQYRSRGYSLSAMFDGVPAYSALSGYQQLDMAIFERVEVLRGPAGLLQGTADLGGSVNLVTKRAEARRRMRVGATLGSWEDRRVTLDATGALDAAGALRARGVLVWQERDSFVEWNHADRKAAYGVLDWDPGPATRIQVSVAWQDERTAAPYSGLPAELETGKQLDVPRSSNITPPWARHDWNTRLFRLSAVQQLPRGWSMQAAASRVEQDFLFHDAFALDGVSAASGIVPMGRREFDITYSRDGIDAFVAGPVQWGGREHQLLLGYNFDRFLSHSNGVNRTASSQSIPIAFEDRASLPVLDLPYESGDESETTQRGLYVQARVRPADRLMLLAGMRLADFKARSRRVAPAVPTPWRPGQRYDSRWIPSAGVLFTLRPEVSLYASYASMFLPQSLQLRADGTPLDPRVGAQTELGAKSSWLAGRLDVSVAAFRIRDHDRALADAANPGFFTNAGLVRSRGWELEGRFEALPGLELQGNYSHLATRYLRGTASQTGGPIDFFAPRNQWSLWVMQRSRAADAATWKAGFGLTGQTAVQPDPARRQGSYTLLAAMAAYQWRQGVALQLNANNLLDKRYYARVGGINSYNTFGTPRSLQLSLRFGL